MKIASIENALLASDENFGAIFHLKNKIFLHLCNRSSDVMESCYRYPLLSTKQHF